LGTRSKNIHFGYAALGLLAVEFRYIHGEWQAPAIHRVDLSMQVDCGSTADERPARNGCGKWGILWVPCSYLLLSFKDTISRQY
jgi:hypothetical protein